MLTADQIDTVVGKFYAAVRQDADLAPIFNNHIHDWPEHEIKIASFWRNAILRERSYAGNPMQKHQAAGDVKPDHFPIWLGLFDEVLQAELRHISPMNGHAWRTASGRGFPTVWPCKQGPHQNSEKSDGNARTLRMRVSHT